MLLFLRIRQKYYFLRMVAYFLQEMDKKLVAKCYCLCCRFVTSRFLLLSYDVVTRFSDYFFILILCEQTIVESSSWIVIMSSI